MAAYKDRIERLELLLQALPLHAGADSCPDPRLLLERLGSLYAHHATDSSRLRAIQRDLEELVSDARASVVNPGGKPLRYRRLPTVDGSDALIRDYARKALRSLIEEALPLKRFDMIWQHLLGDAALLSLGEDRLRIVSDTQRLLPADIRENVLTDVLEALADSRAIKVTYRDRGGKVSHPTLHPQALLQRGPRIYLFALKDAETDPVRMYALHRIIRSSPSEELARQASNFSFQDAIDQGIADFGTGEQCDLLLRARGYVAELIRDCPLSDHQRIEDEDQTQGPGEQFEIRVSARVPMTGQLLRWLLGCGDKLEVLAPDELRQAIRAQTTKAAALYLASD